mgnify:CR=1 FL=1
MSHRQSILLDASHPLRRWDGSGSGLLIIPCGTEWAIWYANPNIYPRLAGYVNTDGEVRLYSEYKNLWSTHHIDPASLPPLPAWRGSDGQIHPAQDGNKGE